MMLKNVVLALCLVAAVVAAGPEPTTASTTAQNTPLFCEEGSCCDTLFKTVKRQGEPCSFSSHPCFDNGVCDGISAKCSRTFKPDGTTCGVGGVCQQGLCRRDGKVVEVPAKSYVETALRTNGINPAAVKTSMEAAAKNPPPAPAPKENKPVEFEDPVLVHEYQDNILDSLRHLPELAKMRQKKHDIEEKKLKAFRKLTHLVIRKHTEMMENKQLFFRHSKERLQDEMQDANNLHRHLHLHHKQNHGLDTTGTEEVEKMSKALLQSTQTESGPKAWMVYLLIGLGVVAVVLIALIVANASKAAKAKPARRDYY